MIECEAERRNLQAVFAIEIAFGSGRIDLGEIKGILTGRDTPDCREHDGTSVKIGV